jgi:hypothetical protein
MDVFKLAFETVMIGLFALPCLCVIIDLANPTLFTSSSILRAADLIPSEFRSQAIAITVFPIAYLLGSVLTPLASAFLNDKDMLGAVLTNEEKIQARAFSQMGAQIRDVNASEKVEPANFRGDDYSGIADDAKIHRQFSYEECTLALGAASSGRLKWLHERMIVLQGATFGSFALMVLCGFAWCGSGKRLDANNQAVFSWVLRRLAALLFASLFISVAAMELYNHRHQPDSGDMPIAELVFLAAGSFGFYVAVRGIRSRLHYHGLTFVVALCFTLLCYVGYTGTGASYDEQVLDTYRALAPANAKDNAHPIARSALTASSPQ